MKTFKIMWIRQSQKSLNFQIKLQATEVVQDELGSSETQVTYYVWRKSTPLQEGGTINIDPTQWKVDEKQDVPVMVDGKEVLMTLRTLLRKL
jgi:hypothetical protein